jgi:hypothetical protein
MITFITNNLGTIVVGAIVAAIVILIAVKLIRDKKQGKHIACDTCNGCDGCGRTNDN